MEQAEQMLVAGKLLRYVLMGGEFQNMDKLSSLMNLVVYVIQEMGNDDNDDEGKKIHARLGFFDDPEKNARAFVYYEKFCHENGSEDTFVFTINRITIRIFINCGIILFTDILRRINPYQITLDP